MSEGYQAAGRLPFPPVMMAVAGASGSGKTTLAVELARALGGLHFSLDNYYRDLGHMPLEQRVRQNFDDPAMIDVGLLARHVEKLSRGEAVKRPVYDFATYTCVPGENGNDSAGWPGDCGGAVCVVFSGAATVLPVERVCRYAG